MTTGNDWRSIETAPKDGTPVELFSPKLGPDDPWNIEGGLVWISGGYGKSVFGVWRGDHGKNPPTHWRPLPPPPAATQAFANKQQKPETLL